MWNEISFFCFGVIFTFLGKLLLSKLYSIQASSPLGNSTTSEQNSTQIHNVNNIQLYKFPPLQLHRAVKLTQNEEYWEYIRTQYYLSYERIYLNTAGLGPAPKIVLDEYTRLIYQQQELSDTAHYEMDLTREKLAVFLGLTTQQASQLAFTRNATEATSIIATGMQLQDGDEFIIDSQAHPGGSLPWLSYQNLKPNVVIKTFTPSSVSVEENLQRILSLITERTRVIQVDHITAPEGILMPIEQIAQLCIDRNIWFHVDGAQAVGMIEVNLELLKCNSYAASCHKWLGAPHGTGFIYVKAENLNLLWPCEVGAYSDASYQLSPPPTFMEYINSSQRFEYGTRDTASVAAIRTAIDFMTAIGMSEVRSRGLYLADYLKSKLTMIPEVTILSPYVVNGSDSALESSITTYSVDGLTAEELYSFLLTYYNLRCRIVTEDGLDALRVSTHIFNFPTDCDLVAEGTQAAILQKLQFGFLPKLKERM